MTLTDLAPVIRPALPARITRAYGLLDEIAELLEYAGPLTEGQRAVHRRILAHLASAQDGLDRLELSCRDAGGGS